MAIEERESGRGPTTAVSVNRHPESCSCIQCRIPNPQSQLPQLALTPIRTVSMPSTEFFALQQAVAGRYSLIEEIGRGGMGVVFKARDLALDRPVAIKLLPPALAVSEDRRRRFLREARTAAALSHPHIVPIHSVEEHDGLVFFVMSLVEGESLGQRVRRAGALPVGEAMRVMQEVAWALAHAHARGVVHRDVKPDNILLDRDGDRALVTDFGIAYTVGRDTPVEGVAMGTPAYMSPEQGAGEEATAQSDLYALGVTAWMAVAGRPPFDGPDAMSFLVQHASEPAPSLATARAGLPDAFVRAVDGCLAKAPGDRWASAEVLAAVLGEERSRVAVVPAPVRVYLREWERAGAEVATAGTAAGVAGVLGLILDALPDASFTASILSAVYLLIAALMGALGAERIAQLGGHARQLLRAGYDARALAVALRRELPARAEEAHSVGAKTGRAFLATGVVALGVGAGSMWGLWQNTADFMTVVLGALSVVAPTVAVRALWGFVQRGSTEGPWNRLASGWLGRAIFRVAGIGLPPVSAPSLEGGEATVLAVGERVRLAHAALPAAQRGVLGDVPSLVARLERDALHLRAGPRSPEGRAKLEEVMAALELLRLDLLKAGALNAGQVELTAAIERVREIGRRVDAMGETERLLGD